MPDPSAASDMAITAAVRAVRGESDLDAVRPALDEDDLARVIACAPEAHHLVRAIAALCGGLPSLLDAPTRADPALHDAVARLIGTPAGRVALWCWTEIAPADWGRACGAALIDAVDRGQCTASAAAALIGPDDRMASRLRSARDIAFAIRWWGQANPDDPTAWAGALSAGERRRLIDDVLRFGTAIAFCLPWLPPDVARAASRTCSVKIALEAFADASPTARRLHAAIVPHLVARTRPGDLDALTRLACATGEKEVWTRVQTLIQEWPGDVWRVVAAAPWDDLPEDVRAAILERADPSDMCAAVAAARGRRDAATAAITEWTAVAFFATLDPDVWDALDPAVQRRWLQHLDRTHTHLAVRSLGVRPEILAQASLTDDLACAVRRCARDDTALHWALMPVAAFGAMPSDAHAVIAAMPTLPDAGAFFVIAGGHGDSAIIARARSALRTSADLALAVTLQRCARGDEPVSSACAALTDALRGRTWDDLPPFLALLTDAARAALTPDRDALVARLAHPDRRDALRQALDRLAALPPDVAVPTCVALTRLTPWNAAAAAEALADTLQAHGDAFLSIMNALADGLRGVWPPPQDDSALACALRALARDAPSTAQRLAWNLRAHDRRAALLALLHAPPQHAAAVWQALSDDMRQEIVAVVSAEASDADPPVIRDLLAVLALAAAHSDDADLPAAGVAALTVRPEITRAIWEQLPSAVQQSLGALPAFADLPITLASPVVRRNLRRGRA